METPQRLHAIMEPMTSSNVPETTIASSKVKAAIAEFFPLAMVGFIRSGARRTATVLVKVPISHDKFQTQSTRAIK